LFFGIPKRFSDERYNNDKKDFADNFWVDRFARFYAAVRDPVPPTPFDPHDPVANAAAAKRWAERDRLDQVANVKILKWSWKKGGFNNVMIGTFTLQNTNDFGVKDIVISCKHFAPSGTLIDSNTRTVYQAIKSKGSLTVKDFNMGLLHTQAAQSSCSVKDFV
jgi:hypothetical protein